jgi:SAM-dependent methyltransferase
MTLAGADAYDTIGRGYAAHRRADPRIMARIVALLGDARSVVDVGAGTGSYEAIDRAVVAVEPSRTMIAQRPYDMPPVVQGVAEALPFADATFDAAMAILTVHHWHDWRRGIEEMRRVARRRIVVMTWDRARFATFWFARDYVPEVCEVERGMPTLEDVTAVLARPVVCAVPVPHDCTDGFFGAYWRRPAAYLDPGVRASISGLAKLGEARLQPAIERLAADLQSGEWERRYSDLRAIDALDLGYRLVVEGR